MPHVADGVLHAYIDGALDALAEAGELPDGMSPADVAEHLQTCADCRARLDAEREIRERAGLILADAVPAHIDVPPFTAIRREPRRPRTLPLAWAASVVLAIGAGWIARDAWRSTPRQTAAEVETPNAPTAPTVTTGEPERPDPPVSLGTTAMDERGVTEAAMQAVPSSVGPVERREAEPPPADHVIADAAADDAGRNPPLGTPRVDTPAPGAAAAAPERSRDAFARRNVAPAPDAPVAQSFLESRTAAQAIAPIITPGPELLRFQAALDRERAEFLWRDRTASDSAVFADQLYVIAHASEPGIQVADRIGQTVARVLQSLDDGTPVELITWRERAVALQELVVAGSIVAKSATQVAPLPTPERGTALHHASESSVREDGRRELVLYDPATSTWIALRADLPDARLRELAGRVVLLSASELR